jgi:hypothetical protein
MQNACVNGRFKGKRSQTIGKALAKSRFTMPPRRNKASQKERELHEHKKNAEDERGWAGQSGQRPANEEEKNYRPHEQRKANK